MTGGQKDPIRCSLSRIAGSKQSDLVDLRAVHLAERLRIVRIVRAAQDRLLDVIHVDLDDLPLQAVRILNESKPSDIVFDQRKLVVEVCSKHL